MTKQSRKTSHYPPFSFKKNTPCDVLTVVEQTENFSSFEEILEYYEKAIFRIKNAATRVLINKRKMGFYDCYGQNADLMREFLIHKDWEKWKHIFPEDFEKKEIDG